MKSLLLKVQIASCICLLVSAPMHSAAASSGRPIKTRMTDEEAYILLHDKEKGPDRMRDVPYDILLVLQEKLYAISLLFANRDRSKDSMLALIKNEMYFRNFKQRSGGSLAPQVNVPRKEPKGWCIVQ